MDDTCNHKNSIEITSTTCYCNDCSTIIISSSDTTIKPVELKKQNDINIIDILNLFKNLPKHVNIKSQYFLDYCNVRYDVIKLLRSLVKKYYVNEEVYYLSLTMIDNILSNNNISCVKQTKSDSFKLTKNIANLNYKSTTVACFSLAVKYIENADQIPEIINDLYICWEDVIEYERITLLLSNYKLNWFTPLSILDICLSIGIFFKSELSPSFKNNGYKPNSIITVLDKLESANQLCYNILNFIISDLKCLEYKVDHLVYSIICIVRNQFKQKHKWHPSFTKLYKIKFEEFEDCYVNINK